MSTTYRANVKTVSVTKAAAATTNYAAEDVISEAETNGVGTAWTFDAIAHAPGGAGRITKAEAICETTALTPRLVLFLFNANPTSEKDDSAGNTALLHADTSKYVGCIEFGAMWDLGGDSYTFATPSTTGGLPLDFKCATGDDALYGILVTRDIITAEVDGDDWIIRLTAERY